MSFGGLSRVKGFIYISVLTLLVVSGKSQAGKLIRNPAPFTRDADGSEGPNLSRYVFQIGNRILFSEFLTTSKADAGKLTKIE